MNTKKGKGKNRPNKPPNPNPPQKVEAAKVPEKVDEVVENIESELKVEERVPEIVSEVVTSPGVEVKIVEEPKKPKRNRGKKKKHDKDDVEESGDDKPETHIVDETKTVIATEESKVEVSGDKPAEKPADILNVAPTARKKKNKNKNTTLEQASKEPDNIPKIEEEKEVLPTEVADANVEEKRDFSPKLTEEVKLAKKKNKKKKRHDSEKSDKAEEISCTAAFQQLLGVDGDKTESKETISEIKTEMIPEVIPGVNTMSEEGIAVENVSKGNKNKKKGKKDKHSGPKVEMREEAQSSIESAEVSDFKVPQDVATDKLKEFVVMPEITPEEAKPIIEEDMKPKAKIAKPVDKKRKEKSNQAIKECEVEISNIPEPPKLEDTTPATAACQIKDPILEQALPEETLFKEKAIQPDDATPTSIPELITLPQSPMEKKRKKSPKPPRQQETKTETEKLEAKEIKGDVDAENEKLLLEMAATERVKENVFEDTPKHKILETPKEMMSAPEFIKEVDKELTKESEPNESESRVNLEVKPSKKRKKSPKPATKLEITEEKELVLQETGSKFKTAPPMEASIISEEQLGPMIIGEKEKSGVLYDIPLMQDIEISSVKGGESEGSIPEIVPDVQYPRAASQQRVDDNNNTIIREVVTPSDVKLRIPVFIPDTPLIQGSDIPLTSPELIASGIRVLDVEANVIKPNEEKTDIKSKMMEVNQDMEELRMSIERSLAELTSIEKSEEIVEKKYEDQIKNRALEENVGSSSLPNVVIDSNKVIGEESQTTESKILLVQKKPMEAIMPAPISPRKGNKKEKSPQIQDTTKVCLPVIPLPPPLPKEEQPKPVTDQLPKEEQPKPVTDQLSKEEPPPVTDEIQLTETTTPTDIPPVCPARKDNKGKGKSKKKGKQEAGHAATSSSAEGQTAKESTQDTKTEEKKQQKPEKAQENTKKQADITENSKNSDENMQDESSSQNLTDFEPIESFEDAMTSSADDVNKSFEMIVSDSSGSHVNPEINIIAPIDDTKSDPKDEKQNPVSPPKNLLGHPVIPARSNKMDYKKEKNKTPNTILAKVKIKDSIEIESKKQSKESQTDNIKKMTQKKSIDESISTLNENEEFVYKYSFRKVFLPSVCHVCKKELKPMRVSCNYCHLLFYCSQKHKDEDYPQHQAFCFAVSTIAHLKNQKHIYEDAAGIIGHNYRLLRMQMIVSCEKILKRKLVPSEQEALLYPRLCGDWRCREYRLNKLADCSGCGQIAYCLSDPDHLPKSHQRWCKSYSLYQKLVCYQQTRGRLEPKLPSRVISGTYQIPDKINEVLAAMYEEKIDMNDVEYAALTQLATAPLTAAFSYQQYTNKINSIYANGTYKKTSFTIHVVGAELQFEADALNKWEVFFMHIRPDIMELRVCLIAPDLNPSNLPLDLLGKVKLCDQCRQDKRRLQFSFQDKKTYSEYYRSDEFITPDIVCAFNPSIQRSSVYNGKDPWPATVSCILKQKVPFIITSHTLEELRRDLARVKECGDFSVVSEPRLNIFASVRPDRNFVTDDETPLLFNNHCVAVVSGVF